MLSTSNKTHESMATTAIVLLLAACSTEGDEHAHSLDTAAEGATEVDSAGIDTSVLDSAEFDDADSGATDPACADSSLLNVATFNIRYAGFSGDNAWYALPVARRDLVLHTMRALDADVFGLQEVLYVQAVDIQAEFVDYHFVGVGRDDGEISGEFAAILLRAERFEILDDGHFWMSDTPEVPGTVFEGSGATRMSTWAVAWDTESERELLILNTHWDHQSSASRQASAALTRARLPALAEDRAVVFTGDLNVVPSDAALMIMLAQRPNTLTQLIDAYRVANPNESADEATFHGFRGNTEGSRIDYVLHTAQLNAASAEIHRDSMDGAYPSDHFPVSAGLTWSLAADGTPCNE